MNRTVISTMFVVALSATMVAQSGGTMSNANHMSQTAKMDKMAADTTYVGCVQSGSAPGTFILRGASQTMKDSTPGGAKAAEGMSHDMMATTTLALRASSVNLRKHIGHRVSVTGSSDLAAKDAMGRSEPTFAVKTIKVVAGSCS